MSEEDISYWRVWKFILVEPQSTLPDYNCPALVSAEIGQGYTQDGQEMNVMIMILPKWLELTDFYPSATGIEKHDGTGLKDFRLPAGSIELHKFIGQYFSDFKRQYDDATRTKHRHDLMKKYFNEAMTVYYAMNNYVLDKKFKIKEDICEF